MEWWAEVRGAAQAFLAQHGLLAAFVFLLIEEAGVPVPVPGDVLMLLAGLRARQGQESLPAAIGVMELATVLGATFLYTVAARGGRGAVYRYGRYLHLTPERLDQAEGWLARHGLVAVVLGRLIPGLRILTSIGCGVFGVPPWTALPALAAGALLYIVTYTLIGFFVGEPVLAALERLHLPLGVLGSLAGLVALLVWLVRARRSTGGWVEKGRPAQPAAWRDGVLAGVLAALGASLLLNVLIHVVGGLAPRETRLQETSGPVMLVLTAPGFVVLGTVWGVVFVKWAEPRLSRLADAVRGLLFSLLPLAVGLAVLLPVLRATDLVVGGEVLRDVTYGLLVGLISPVLRVRNRRGQ